MHVKTLPTTIPFKLPFIDSLVSIPSTSKPKSVNNSPILVGSQLICRNCCNQLYDIFICFFQNFNAANLTILIVFNQLICHKMPIYNLSTLFLK